MGPWTRSDVWVPSSSFRLGATLDFEFTQICIDRQVFVFFILHESRVKVLLIREKKKKKNTRARLGLSSNKK